jgi:hypothetical protein
MHNQIFFKYRYFINILAVYKFINLDNIFKKLKVFSYAIIFYCNLLL